MTLHASPCQLVVRCEYTSWIYCCQATQVPHKHEVIDSVTVHRKCTRKWSRGYLHAAFSPPLHLSIAKTLHKLVHPSSSNSVTKTHVKASCLEKYWFCLRRLCILTSCISHKHLQWWFELYLPLIEHVVPKQIRNLNPAIQANRITVAITLNFQKTYHAPHPTCLSTLKIRRVELCPELFYAIVPNLFLCILLIC